MSVQCSKDFSNAKAGCYAEEAPSEVIFWRKQKASYAANKHAFLTWPIALLSIVVYVQFVENGSSLCC